MYLLLFAHLYEVFFEIDQPFRAIEDLFLEFKTNILNDGEVWGLAQLYAGCAAWEVTAQERERIHKNLRVYYDTALRLLKGWSAER
jgi:hypothetical protein